MAVIYNIRKLKHFLMSTDFAETYFYLVLNAKLNIYLLGCRKNFVC